MLNRTESTSNCFAFTTPKEKIEEPWEKGQIYDRTIRSFKAYIGPSGGKKGYQAMTGKYYI